MRIFFSFCNNKCDIVKINTNYKVPKKINVLILTRMETCFSLICIDLLAIVCQIFSILIEFDNGFKCYDASSLVLRHLLLSHPVCNNVHHGHGCSCSSNAFQRTFWTKCKFIVYWYTEIVPYMSSLASS